MLIVCLMVPKKRNIELFFNHIVFILCKYSTANRKVKRKTNLTSKIHYRLAEDRVSLNRYFFFILGNIFLSEPFKVRGDTQDIKKKKTKNKLKNARHLATRLLCSTVLNDAFMMFSFEGWPLMPFCPKVGHIASYVT